MKNILIFSINMYTSLLLLNFVIVTYAEIVTQPLQPMERSSEAFLAPFLNKKYKLETSDDNFDDLLKALGVGVVKRHLAKLAKPVMELRKKDGEYTLTSKSVYKQILVKFKIGEEFEEYTPDGRKARSVFTVDKNKLIQIQRDEKHETITEREFTPEQVEVTVQVDDIVSVRIYKPL